MRPPLIERVTVEGYRALRDVHLKGVQPLTVLVGPNGSGKSTFFDVFAFLGECFSDGVRRACDKRNGLADMRSRGYDGPVRLEFAYREAPGERLMTYVLELAEHGGRPVISKELLRWSVAPSGGRPTHVLEFANGSGFVVDEATGEKTPQTLAEPDLLAVNALGQLKDHPRVEALRRFITGWHVSYLTASAARGVPEAGPQEHLSRSGENLANVLQYLREQHPDRLRSILASLSSSIPQLESATDELSPDGRLVLWLKDAPFERPVLSRYASDGTLKMLAYLVLLHDPDPAPFIGIEEPENYLYPTLLEGLATQCKVAAERSQVLVTSHSHEFLNALDPGEVVLFARDESGYTKVHRPLDVTGIGSMLDAGAHLGWLWREGYLEAPRPELTVPDQTA
ncbi:MAG: AAA family ATPase [Mycobacteriales bacterium]|nr:AAA family ATPase [Mycobacteriales bacterium]